MDHHGSSQTNMDLRRPYADGGSVESILPPQGHESCRIPRGGWLPDRSVGPCGTDLQGRHSTWSSDHTLLAEVLG
jgi:hypothetical protein